MVVNTAKTVVLITGANRGIGFAIVEALIAESDSSTFADGGPYHIFLASRSLEKGKAAAAALKPQHGNEVSVVQLDVLSSDSVVSAVEAVKKETGRVDVLINNVGVFVQGIPDPVELLRQSLEQNLISAYAVTDRFKPLLLAQPEGQDAQKKNKRIINVTSGMGSISRRVDKSDSFYKLSGTEYRIAKAAMNMMAVCQDFELEAEGVKAFAYNPGYTATYFSGDPEWVRASSLGHEVDVPGKACVLVVDGRRDGDRAKILEVEGVWDW